MTFWSRFFTVLPFATIIVSAVAWILYNRLEDAQIPPWLTDSECFRKDLQDLIEKMEDNPRITKMDWQELLPVCRYADEWFRATHPIHNEHYGDTTECSVREYMA